jgi:hypothetical protein
MWIVYQKKDRRVVGMTALGAADPARETALAEVVKGLAAKGSVDKYDCVQIEDAEQALALLSTPFDQITIGEAARGRPQVAVEARELGFLQLECDARTLHPVDGVPSVKADGTSFTTVTVRKVDAQGQPRKSRSDGDELYVRTTAGKVLTADGKQPLTSLKLKQGEAAFRLVSENARRLATVTVFNADTAVHDGSFRVEFV